MTKDNENALEQRARRAAKRAGLIAKKSRWRLNSIDNYGGFQVVDPYTNFVQAGVRFDLSPEQVISFCSDD